MYNYKYGNWIILLVIVLSGSLYYATSFQNALLIPFMLFLAVLYFNRLPSVHISKIYFLLFCLSLVISNSQFVTSSVLVLMSCLFSAFIITEIYDFEYFARVYVKIMLFLSIASWGYLIVILLNVKSPLPNFNSIVGIPYSDFIFFGIPGAGSSTNGNISRNCGIFWEPGAFEIFVNTAYYFAIILNRVSKKLFLVFFITILTIQSTTGYAVFLLLAVVNYIRTNDMRSRGKNFAMFFLGLSCVLIFAMTKLFTAVVDKFHEGSSLYVSFLSRSSDFLIDAKMFLENILMGVGYGNYAVREHYGISMMGQRLYDMATPTGSDGLLLFMNYVGIFGIVAVWRLIYPSQIKQWSFFERLLVMTAMVAMYNSENMFLYLLPWVMVFYGFKAHANSATRSYGRNFRIVGVNAHV